MAKREGRSDDPTDSVQDGAEYDSSEGAQPHPLPSSTRPKYVTTGESSLVYGGTGGEMSGKYGNNFVNMQAYLQANNGAKNMLFGRQANPGEALGFEPSGDYTPGMAGLDQGLKGFATQNRERVGGSAPERPDYAGGQSQEPGGVSAAAAATSPKGNSPVYAPAYNPAGAQPMPAAHDTSTQAAQQGFQSPNFAAMGQQMANRKQSQAGGGY